MLVGGKVSEEITAKGLLDQLICLDPGMEKILKLAEEAKKASENIKNMKFITNNAKTEKQWVEHSNISKTSKDNDPSPRR